MTDITHEFRDENFIKAVREQLQKDADDPIYKEDTEKVTSLNLGGVDLEDTHIKDLTGIEYFTALENLKVFGKQLAEIDISNNIALKKL